MDTRLNYMIKAAIDAVTKARIFAEDENLLHTQEYIDFENELNQISTMDPDVKIERSND